LNRRIRGSGLPAEPAIIVESGLFPDIYSKIRNEIKKRGLKIE